MAALISTACAELSGEGETENTMQACQTSEAPFGEGGALIRAQATFQGDPGEFTGRLHTLPEPVRVTSLTINAGADEPTISFIIEAPGASSETPE